MFSSCGPGSFMGQADLPDALPLSSESKVLGSNRHGSV